MKRLSLISQFTFLVIVLVCGCGENTEPPMQQAVAESPSRSAPLAVQDEPGAHQPDVHQPDVDQPDGGDVDTIDREARDPVIESIDASSPPKRPADSWVIFREAFDAEQDATCETKWLGRNRFQVKTRNIQRMTVDLKELPRGAPETGPWVLLIDGQGVEMTGFKPKKGYTGLKRDLIRSPNGRWTVDRRKLYRPGE